MLVFNTLNWVVVVSPHLWDYWQGILCLRSIIPEPMTLVGHFFAVAMYGMFCIWTGPIYLLPWNIIKSFIVLWNAVLIIYPLAIAELR
jgi:squalene monooxygenase